MSEISQDVLDRAANIRLLLLDVDGVLSDGKLYYSENGVESKSFHTLDGHGIRLLQSQGVEVGIITGRSSDIVARRAAELGITILVQACRDKLAAVATLSQELNISYAEMAFMGDDHPDLPPMLTVGLALTTADAHPDVVARAHWQSRIRGGEGAVREACDLILKAQGNYEAVLSPYVDGFTTQ